MAKKEKTELEIFQEFVDWFHELVWGTPRRPEAKPGGFTDVDKGFSKKEVRAWKDWSKAKQPDLPENGLMSKEKLDIKKMRKKDLKVLMDKLSLKYNSGDTKADLIQKIEWGTKE